MKKLKFWSITLALTLLSIGNVFGETIKFDFSDTKQMTTATSESSVWTVGNATMSINSNCSGYLSAPLRVYSGVSLTFKTLNGLYFESIVAYLNSGKAASGMTNSTWTGANLSANGYVITFTPTSDNVQTISTSSASAQFRLDSVVCVLKSACEAPAKELTLSPSSLSLEIGQDVKFSVDGGNGGTIVYTSGDSDVATVDAEGNVHAVAKGSTTITATQAANEGYCSQETEVAVSVMGESYTITWQGPEGSTTSKVEQGAPLGTLGAAVASCDPENYPEFIGWCDTNIGKTPITEVTLIDETIIPRGNTTYYAVFANEKPVVDGYTLVTDVADLKTGDLVVIANKDKKVAGALQSGSNPYLAANDAVFENDGNKVVTTDALVFQLGGTIDAWTFTEQSSNALLGCNGAKKMTLGSGTTTWTLESDGDYITIQSTGSGYGYIQYNSANPRFTTYTSWQGGAHLYKYSKGNLEGLEFISQCCDAWTDVPTISYDNYNLDSDDELAKTSAAPTVVFPDGMEDYTGTRTFESSNIAVATVDNDGVVTAVGSGICVIRTIWSGDSKYCDMTIASDTFHVAGKFSVAYNPNAEGVTGEMEAKQYLGDTKIGLDTCKFVRTGYHFIGWAASSDGRKMYNDADSLIIVATMNLYAVWEINNYEVTKGEEINGAFTLSSDIVEHGGSIIVTQRPMPSYKKGTVVISPAENGEVLGDTIKNITGAIEVTVNFEEKTKYAITWHSCNGEVETTYAHEGFQLADEEGVATPKGSCSDNHTYFYGWAKEEYGNLGDPKTEAPAEIINDKLIPESDCDFYAVYANGAVGGGAKMTSIAVGDQVVIIAGDSVELSGIESNASGSTYFGSVSSYSDTPTGIYTLEVVEGASEGTYALKHGDEYLLALDANALNVTNEVNQNSSWSITFDNEIVTIKNNSVNANRWIQFNNSARRFASYQSGQKPISLYNMKSAATEFITSCCEYLPFEVKNDTLLFEADTYQDLSEYIIGSGNNGEFHYALAEEYDPANIELDGSVAYIYNFGDYRFIISQDAKFGGHRDTCGVEKELFIHAASNYCTIIYDKNNENAEGEMEDEDAVDNYSQHKIAANAFTLTGYHFLCWNTEADGTGERIMDEATIEARNLTLYAQWEINTYNISIADPIENGSIRLSSDVVEHGGSIIVTTIPDFGYKFSALVVDPSTNCTVSRDTIFDIVGDITVGAEFVTVPVYTITYRDSENDSITTERVEEGGRLNPDPDLFGCARMPLVGFSETEVQDNSKTYTAIDLGTYTVTEDATLWAVYTLNKGESGEFNPNRTKSGNFKISAIVDGAEYFAASWSSTSAVGKYNYSLDEEDAQTFTFTQVSEGVYTIKQGAKYIVVNKANGTDLAKRDTLARWLITPGITNGSWRVVNEATNRALMYRTSNYSVFGAYGNAAGGEYFDIEIGHNNANIYSSTPLCSFIDVTGISLDTTSAIIRNCENEGKLQLTATVAPADATIKDVIWTSSNESVVTVDENGLVSFVSNGSATITATTKDEGKTATCKIIARYCVSDVELNKTSLEFLTCENTDGASLTATVSPSAAYDKSVTWSSDNTEVATVSTNGYVKVVGVGEAIITVTTNDGNYTASCFVKVRECVLAQEIRLNKDSLHFLICEGNTEQLTATIVPDSVDITKITWNSSNNKIAKVNASGVVTPVAIGTAKITASATDGSGVKAQCVVVIEDCESAVELVSISNHIFTREGVIVVENANDEDVFIYNAIGQMVASKTHVTDMQIALPAGAYVVRLGNTMTKVIVK